MRDPDASLFSTVVKDSYGKVPFNVTEASLYDPSAFTRTVSETFVPHCAVSVRVAEFVHVCP